MKRLYIIAFTTLVLVAAASAQENQYGFGDVTFEELNLKRYDKDPEAEALVLCDIGDSYFFDTDNGYDIRFTRIKRIKIFNKSGIRYATVTIPFYTDGYGRTELVKSIEANCYNMENGAVVEAHLNPKSVYEEVVSDHWKAKKFVIPNVREGSVIEFKYMLETPFHFNLPDWEFQGPIPALLSQYVVSMIPFYDYKYIIQGTPKLDIKTVVKSTKPRVYGSVSEGYAGGSTGFKFNDLVHTFGMKDIPAFRDEYFITSRNDYIIKLDFQLANFYSPTGTIKEIMTTWPKMIDEFLKHEDFGGYIKKCKKPAEDALYGLKSTPPQNQEEQCQKIIEFVKTNFKWNENYGKFTDKSPKELLIEKQGNPADINLFMIAMLQAAGMNADPVILSTRDNGKVKVDYPFESFFNYVIAAIRINDRLILADGTEPMLAFDCIPTRCINEFGLLISDADVSWIALGNSNISTNRTDIKITVDPENMTARADVAIAADQYEAYNYKTTFQNDLEDIAGQLTMNNIRKISGLKTQNYEDASKPYLLSFEAETELESINNQIIISQFLHFPITDNKLKTTVRTYPVDMVYPVSFEFVSTIIVPSLYKVTSVPDNFLMDNELMSIKLNYTVNDDQIEAKGNYTYKKGVYSTSEYSRLKSYINAVIEEFNKPIIVEPVL